MSLRNTINRLALAALVPTSALLATPAQGQGDLLVAPTRIILDGRRGTEVVLSNIGPVEATYRIGMELRRMTPDGDLEDVPLENANAVEQAALEMIRYAPRRITLPPGQPQAVRISARPAADLPDGEYRAHLYFRAIPKPKPLTEQSAQGQPATGISIELTPIYGVTIPIIVRHGRVEAQAALSNPRMAQGELGPQLEFDVARSGGSSLYGEVLVYAQGNETPVHMVRGVAVYPELSGRTIRLRLTEDQRAALKGPVRIEYREPAAQGGGLIASVDTVLG